MVAGPAALIKKVHRIRKMVGGGMRQVGVLAAAGLLALTEMPKRLHEDHANARMLAEGLAALPQIELDLASVQTNIIVFGLRDTARTPETLVAQAREHGVLLVPFKGRVRAVTHNDVSSADCEAALEVIAELVRE